MKSLFKKGIGLFLAIAFIVLLLTSPVIFQEGNPIPVTVAAFKITVLGEPIAKIYSDPETYMVKTRNGYGAADAPFMELKKQQGYVFKDRSVGPYFEGYSHYYRADSRAFTKNYLVIEVNPIDYDSYPNELK